MNPLAVVAYPILSADDRQWIEGVRARYDPLASRIAAHFTLVFPTAVDEAPLEAHVRDALRSRGAIAVVLRRAAVFADVIGGNHCVFLLADDGRRELVTAHDALYRGALAAHARPDVPFVPHVTVGAHAQVAECERIARRLNDQGRMVHARIEGVDIVEVAGSAVRTLVTIPLGPGGARPSRRSPSAPGPPADAGTG